MLPARIALLICMLPVAALPLPAQQQLNPVPASPNPFPTITTAVRQVVLDVVVADKRGLPLEGLKKSDFILSEDGQPQNIVAFTERDAVAEASPTQSIPPPQLPPNTFSNHAPVTNNAAMTVIVFDTNDLEWEAGYYARYQVAEYLKSVTPGTPLCIFKLDPYGLQLIQDFTTDSRALKKAVQSNRNAQWSQLNRLYAPPSHRVEALRQLAAYLSSFPGRRNLIWFGGGDSQMASGGRHSLLPDSDTFNHDLKQSTDTLTLNRVALYIVDPRGVVMDVNEVANIMLDGADLSKTAATTGGKAFYNNNGLKQIVARVIASGSHYYTLAYTPSNTNWDGNLRKINVKLVNNGLASIAGQPQLKAPIQLEYRSGYYATRVPATPRGKTANEARRLISYSPNGDPGGPGHALQPKPTAMDTAMTFATVPPFQILFQAQITPSPTTAKTAHNAKPPKDNYLEAQWLHSKYRNYRIHYLIDPHDIQFTQHSADSYGASVEFIAVAYDEHGNTVNSLITTTPVELSTDEYVSAMNNGMRLDQTIAVPTHGQFYFRLGVHDIDSGRIGALQIPAESIKLPTPGR